MGRVLPYQLSSKQFTQCRFKYMEQVLLSKETTSETGGSHTLLPWRGAGGEVKHETSTMPGYCRNYRKHSVIYLSLKQQNKEIRAALYPDGESIRKIRLPG